MISPQMQLLKFFMHPRLIKFTVMHGAVTKDAMQPFSVGPIVKHPGMVQ